MLKGTALFKHAPWLYSAPRLLPATTAFLRRSLLLLWAEALWSTRANRTTTRTTRTPSSWTCRATIKMGGSRPQNGCDSLTKTRTPAAEKSCSSNRCRTYGMWLVDSLRTRWRGQERKPPREGLGRREENTPTSWHLARSPRNGNHRTDERCHKKKRRLIAECTYGAEFGTRHKTRGAMARFQRVARMAGLIRAER